MDYFWHWALVASAIISTVLLNFGFHPEISVAIVLVSCVAIAANWLNDL